MSTKKYYFCAKKFIQKNQQLALMKIYCLTLSGGFCKFQ